MMKPQPSRITTALNAAGLYGPEVDAALGVEEPAVDMWESGELVPTPEQLVRLASLTGMTVGYFFGPPIEPFVGWVCQRSGKGRGCYRVDERPDAPVIELHPSTLFR